MSVDVAVRVADAVLTARLTVPRRPVGVVVLISGAAVPSAADVVIEAVADALLRDGVAVLCPPHRPAGREPSVDELTGRVVALTRWTRDDPDLAVLPVGYFATGLGAAAALRAAAELDGEIAAVVCSQGRADLAGAGVAAVTAATLLVVGGADPVALDRNGGIEPLLRCRSALEIVPGATRRFDEVGAVDRVVDLATAWFGTHLGATTS